MAKQINPLDQPLASANKYYKSSDTSVIDKSVGNPRRQPVRPAVTPDYVNPQKARQADMLRSADVYYAATGSLKPIPGTPVGTVDPTVIQVTERAALPAAIDHVVSQLQNGLTVRVALRDRTWLAAAQLMLIQAVSREAITEDQSRDVQFGLLNLPTPAAPVAQPAAPAPVLESSPVEPAFEVAAPVADMAEILAVLGDEPAAVPEPELAPAPEVPAIPIDEGSAFDDDSDSDDVPAEASPPVAPIQEETPPAPVQDEPMASGSKRQRRRKDTT